MKKQLFLVWMVVVALGLLAIGNTRATAYIINGDVSDWGINLSLATSRGYLDTNLPSGGLDIDYTTEDNADTNSEWTEVGPLWSYYNLFDAEAMYFDNDHYYAYIAIIQGLPKGGETGPGNPWFLPGDIAIDADSKLNTGEYGYEYGLDISNSHLYANPDWKQVYYPAGSEANPWEINENNPGTDKGEVLFAYSDNQNSHYVLEAAIPLSDLGLDADSVHNLRIHWAQECGNDYLNLNADINHAPEPATMLLLGSGLIGLGWFGRRKARR
ncbi:MAG: PEP-CTERM sorting domain-containing protein [Thermodesulfobacteriota bacterium]|nr:PEP-CTERM sorting domain-containing protein [Thermodesulfobacteriota bacterium]